MLLPIIQVWKRRNSSQLEIDLVTQQPKETCQRISRGPKGGLHLCKQLAFGWWITWFITSWEENNCMHRCGAPKAEIFRICLKRNFVKPHKISTHSAHSANFCFHILYPLSDWVEILSQNSFFKQMLKVSVFYLEKQKSFMYS